MSKKNRRKSDPTPAREKGQKSRWLFWGMVTLLLGGMLVAFYNTKLTYRHINKTGETAATFSAGEKRRPVVARTVPEEGEVLSTAIIEKEGEVNASSITILTQPPRQVLDLTPALQETTPPPTIVEDVEAARLAQATLHLSRVSQAQSLRLLALYTAFTTGAPEAMTLLAQAQAAAQGDTQAKILESLAEASRGKGPLTRWDVLMALPGQPEAEGATMATEGAAVALPGLWGQTLSRLVTVRKASSRQPAQAKTASPLGRLNRALRRGDIAGAQDLLQEEAFADASFDQVRDLLGAYQQQRAALLQLLP
jgi:hypothetical protein